LISRHTGARAFIPVALAAAILISLAPSTPAAAAGPTTTEAAQIIRIAKAQLGDPWRYGATGPTAFDCSGLVIYAYRQAGDGSVIRAGTLRTARSIYLYFKSHGKASRTNPRIGDLVVWGYGTHIGIYIGNGKAISTLTNGVRIHGVFAVTARFTAYLHTGMSGQTAHATVSTKATAAVTAARTTIRHARHAINLRRGPGVAFARLRTLSSGARLAVFGRRADSHGRTWYEVRVAGRTGWVAGWLTR
jgi:Cell wall-associated hydrolases (invasion-associated proteins)